MKQIINFLKGFIIGAGVITPGVSGGVLAMIMNVYEEIIEKFNTFAKDIKNNTRFLGPIILGLIFGIFVFGNVLNYLFANYEDVSKFAFSGFIIGSIPFLFKKTKGIKKLNLWIFFGILIPMSTLLVLEKNNLLIDLNQNFDTFNSHYLLYFIMGLLYIMGKIIPGLSSSVLLILLGQYQYFLYLISSPFSLKSLDYINLMFIILGMIIGGIILVKLLALALKKYYYVTYSAVLAFVISSIIALIPINNIDTGYGTGLILMVLTMLLSYKISYRK